MAGFYQPAAIIRPLMIALRQVTFARAGRPLVIDASVQLHAGWKVGVVGANGCGKSSLFALLRMCWGEGTANRKRRVT